MDQEGTDCGKLLAELKSRFSEGCIDFGRVETGAEEVIEEIAVCDEQTMEEYLEKGSVAAASIRRLGAERKIFPCYFGSALKLDGVQELLAGFEEYADPLHLYHCVVGGYVCLSGSCGLQSEHPDTVCAGACHRYGGG